MNEQIRNIYRLAETPLVTLECLVKNITLEQYSEVRYYKEQETIFCQLTFTTADEEITALYAFENGWLMTITIRTQLNETEVFNRNNELEKLLYRANERESKNTND